MASLRNTYTHADLKLSLSNRHSTINSKSVARKINNNSTKVQQSSYIKLLLYILKVLCPERANIWNSSQRVTVFLPKCIFMKSLKHHTIKKLNIRPNNIRQFRMDKILAAQFLFTWEISK